MADAYCVFCHDPIDATRDFRKVEGWERKAQAASRRSGSDIKARRQLDLWACRWCVQKVARGLSHAQGSLI
jgi:hypothetical protein